MPSLTLKNLPPDLLVALREAAQRDRRSLSQEIVHLLELALGGRTAAPVSGRGDIEAQVAAWRELAGKWESSSDFATEVRGIFDARSAGRGADL